MIGRTRAVVMAVLALLVLTVSPAAAGTSPPSPGSVGHDVSYPQCSGSSSNVGASGGQFGIVGVTNGLPWSASPCLAAEYQWAAALPGQPALYMNTANPAPRSSFYWPATGSSDPALCAESTSTVDPGCAYDYGWHAAANALGTATSTIGAAASNMPWWLDVETANTWNGSTTANAADLQGGLDYLRSHGVPVVGLYSIAGSWNTITGGYAVSNASSYASAWSSAFSPMYPMSQSPTWVAGAGPSSGAGAVCGSAAFTGPTPKLAQYRDTSGLDADLVCGAAPTQSVAVSVNPSSATVKLGAATSASITITEAGSPQPVDLTAASARRGPTLSLSPTQLPGPGTATLTINTRGVTAGTYVVTVTATTATGATASGDLVLTVRRK
jgi:hypothetical protein